ncbi:hypothetical protein JYU34_015493 [Plutella xylostella]|uniref:Uncharacterized protein n=1 Tax=Plutella xylostella TaxID=51655 RepID=A0ABQ7Q774_PLUXY|nr:hypothetical protein JYU34_015493 [Plutella xylostella]
MLHSNLSPTNIPTPIKALNSYPKPSFFVRLKKASWISWFGSPLSSGTRSNLDRIANPPCGEDVETPGFRSSLVTKGKTARDDEVRNQTSYMRIMEARPWTWEEDKKVDQQAHTERLPAPQLNEEALQRISSAAIHAGCSWVQARNPGAAMRWRQGQMSDEQELWERTKGFNKERRERDTPAAGGLEREAPGCMKIATRMIGTKKDDEQETGERGGCSTITIRLVNKEDNKNRILGEGCVCRVVDLS